MIKKYLSIIGIVLLTNISIFSQSVTNSPYTFFGIGEIDRNGFNHSKAMGGLSTGLRMNNQINYMNPAAISAQDTMSFIFDLGMNGIFKDMESSVASSEFKDFAFDHIALSFPITKWWYMSLGATPYSKIGYNIQQSMPSEINDTIYDHYDNYGNGGINQLFISNSFNIYKNLSIGFNFNYLFGSLEKYNMVYYDLSSYATVIVDEISLKRISYDIGAQYYNTINDKYFYTVGLTYAGNVTFNTTIDNAVLNTTYHRTNLNIIDYLAMYSSDTISYNTSKDFKLKVPAKFSLGFSGGIKNKLTIGFDYSYQDWTDIASVNQDYDYEVDETFNLGIEYIPNKYALRGYYKRVSYRAGGYYNNSYIVLNNEQIKNYGITFGLGFPIANQRTSINFSCSIGKRGTTDNNLIQENYTAFGINLTLYDFWFIKRKFQ